MRKLLLLAFLIGFQFFTFAQAPEGFTYQSVVRDASGQLFAGRVVGMRISILQNSASGIAVYTETHNANTNANGLLTLEIGTGSSSNNFATIDWSNGPYFIQAEVSLANDGSYTITSTSQLLSVPYALHAKTAENVLNTPAETDPVFTNSVAAAINANDTATWNLDNDAFNELQILSINNDTIFLTNSGFIVLPETFSGNYNDLNNKPNFPDSVNAYGFNGNYNNLTNAPNLSNVATSGNYSDLSNKPNFPDSVNAYGFDGNYNSLTNAPNLSNVATSGNYNDLNNKPNLSNVATSGNYSDLVGSPQNISDFVNDLNFINTEIDPLFMSSIASGISATDTMKWNNKLQNESQTIADVAAINNQINNQIKNLSEPSDSSDAATKAYVDSTRFPQGNAIGEMRYWDGSNWVAIAPGSQGQYLTFCYGAPIWGPCSGSINSLNCSLSNNIGILIEGEPAIGVNSVLTYIGNGGTHNGQIVSSNGVLGLTATLSPGNITNGAGSLTYAISGTPTSSGNANFALNIGGQSCTLSLNVNMPMPIYPSGTVHCLGTPTAVVEVSNPVTGRIWMDRNLGASQAATSSTDSLSYGDLYQWGRGPDGHQCRNSNTTSVFSSSDQSGHGEFILAPNSPYDWRSPQNSNLWQGINGVNNPCPSEYRLPTETELNAERLSWGSGNATGAFTSPLKLTMGAVRWLSGTIIYVDTDGSYWSSTASGTAAKSLVYSNNYATISSNARARGQSVRCIKD